MNRETNMYLRSILDREKAALIASRGNLPKSAKEAIEKLHEIDKGVKSIDEGLNLLMILPADSPTTETVENKQKIRDFDDALTALSKEYILKGAYYMAKYKVGDKVRIVSERPQYFWNPEMDKYLGKTMTIIESGINPNGVYYHMEDSKDFDFYWYWYEDMIAGIAEQKKPAEQKGDNNMKTETNLYLRSLIGEKKAALRGYHEEELRKLNDALTALRSEESQKQQIPALSEKTVEAIRHLLEIRLESADKMLHDIIKCILSFVPVSEERDKIVLETKTKVSEATTALNEFNAAYPKKPESK